MTEIDTEDAETTVAAQQRAGSTTAAPYMPFRTLINLLDRFREEGGPPAVLDKSYFGNTSGSTIAQNRSGLRFFDLIDEEYEPTDTLKTLVECDDEDRKGYLRMMVEEKYPDAMALSPNATMGQLDKVFTERGLTGATVSKAVSFYLAMTEYVGIPTSAHFKRRRTSNGSATRRRRPAAKPQDVTPPPPPAPTATTEGQQKAKYVEMLMALASKDEAEADTQRDLLDRIEKALNIGSAAGGAD